MELSTSTLGSSQTPPPATEPFDYQTSPVANSIACFPRLPTELRLDIWELALPERRVVAFDQTSAADEFSWEAEHLTVHADKICLLQTFSGVQMHRSEELSTFYFPELARPVYLRPKYDLILATSTAALLFMARSFRQHSSLRPSARDVRILGLSFGKPKHDDHSARSAQSREVRAVAPIYSALRKLNSLEKLVVYYSACMTPGTMGDPLQKHLEAIKKVSIAKGRADSSYWKIPSIVTGNYDCQAGVTEIEEGLRALMEQQLELMENPP